MTARTDGRPFPAGSTSRTLPVSAAGCLGALRIAAGAALARAPARAGRLLVGEDAAAPGARLVIAAFGARDLLLGLGVVGALERRQSPRPWLAACAAADAFDALACLAVGRGLGRRLATRSFLASAVPALPEAWLATRPDRPEATGAEKA